MSAFVNRSHRLSKPHRLIGVALLLVLGFGLAQAEEPPALNPFAPVQREREDIYPGYIEMSDGEVHVGNIYMTRDKRLQIYEESIETKRQIPLRVVKQIECKVIREWVEREWRFKELALNEKYYTGRTYPSRLCEYTITLQDNRTITGPVAEIMYIKPIAEESDSPSAKPAAKAQRLMINKRDKGDFGTDLKSLVYVKLIKLGEEALEEGRRKAAKYRPSTRR